MKMHKQKRKKEDGRTLIYYTFSGEELSRDQKRQEQQHRGDQ